MLIVALFFIYLFLIAFAYLIGGIINPKGALGNNSIKSFEHIFIGSLSIILCFALLKSGFTSFVIVCIPSTLLYFYFKGHLKNISSIRLKLPPVNKRQTVTTVSLALISFFYWSRYSIDYSTMSIIQGHYDFSFYSEIARGLMKEGIESTDVRFTPLYHPSGTILYHYFDLWLTALLSILSNISTFRILMVVVYPFFYFLTLLGISSFIEKYSENILSLILLPFLLTFTLTLNIPLLKELDLFNYSNFGIHLSKYL